MASVTTKLPLSAIGGTLAILLFCIFTLASSARYPGPFSPMDNWLSDLGTATKNPLGHAYFNMGCILTGACLLLLITDMGAWRTEDKKKTPLFTLGRACGALSTLALMLIGVFDEGTSYHLPLSVAFFLLQFLFIALVNASLWKHPAYDERIGYSAALAAIINIVFVYTFIAYEHAPVWEWLSVFSALLWVALFSYNMLKLEANSAS